MAEQGFWDKFGDDALGLALAFYQQQQNKKTPNFYPIPLTDNEKWVSDRQKELYGYSPTRDFLSSAAQQMLEQNSTLQAPNFISPIFKNSGSSFGAGLQAPKIDFSRLPQAPWAVNRPGATTTPTQNQTGGTGLIGSGMGDAHQPFNRIDNGAFDGNTVWGGAGSYFGDNGVMGEIDRGMRGMRNDPNNRVHAGNRTGDPNYNPGPLPPAASGGGNQPTGAWDPVTGTFGGGDTPSAAGGGMLGKVGEYVSNFLKNNPNAGWNALAAGLTAAFGPQAGLAVRLGHYIYGRVRGGNGTEAPPTSPAQPASGGGGSMIPGSISRGGTIGGRGFGG